MKSVWIISLCCASALLPVQIAHAQVEVPPEGLRVVPTVRLLYDDNLLRQNDDLIPGDKDDLRITPSVDVTFNRQFGMHRATLVGSLGYDFHQRFEGLDRERITLVGTGDLQVSGTCHIRPRARLNFAQSNLADQGVRVGNSQRTQDYQVTAECDKPYGYYPVVTLGYLTTQNSARSREPFDINTKSAGIGFAYSKASLGDLRLMLNFDAFRRPNVDQMTIRRSSGADNYRVGLEFRRSVAPRLSWYLGASYIHTRALDAEVEDFSGLGFMAGAAYKPSQRFSLLVDAQRSTRNQSNTGATYIVQTDITLRSDLRVGSRTTFSAGAAYAKRDFEGELLIDTETARGSDSTKSLFAGVRYNLRNRMNIGYEVRHEWRTTDVDRYRYKFTSAMLLVGFQL